MKIRFLLPYASPTLTASAGQVLDVDAVLAKQLIKIRAAEALEKAKEEKGASKKGKA